MSDVFCLEIGRFRSFMADIYKNGRIHAKSASLCIFLSLRESRISEQRYCGSKSRVKWKCGNCTFFLNPCRYCSKKEERANQRDGAFLVRIELLERQTVFYYSCAKLETASFKICPLKLPVRSKGKTSVRW